MSKMSSASLGQKRHWCFTLWLDEDVTYGAAEHIARRICASKDLRYGICQLEHKIGQKMHLQGYLEFTKSLRMNEVKSRAAHPKMHLEPRLGSRADARSYCMSKTWKGEHKGQVAGPWHQGQWISDVRGSTPSRKSDKETCIELLLQGYEPYEIAAMQPVAFFTHSRKVLDTYRHLNEARVNGIWEADSREEEE